MGGGARYGHVAREGSEKKAEKRKYFEALKDAQIKLKKEVRLGSPAIGLGGIVDAHYNLKARGSKGILIGGLAKNIWEYDSAYGLQGHKDVDVINLGNKGIFNFESNIDWWDNAGIITRIEDEEVRERYERRQLRRMITTEKTRFLLRNIKNGNGVTLRFDVEFNKDFLNLESGLYIPSEDFIRDMIMAESKSHVREFNEEEYNEVEEELFRESLNYYKLPKCIEDIFRGYILSLEYEGDERKVKSIWIKKEED